MDKVISRTISEIDKVKNENLELNDKLNRAREENEQLKEENDNYAIQLGVLAQALQEIRDIADGMHDWWINKTQYTDVYELAEHLLKTELNRIIDKINEVIGAE